MDQAQFVEKIKKIRLSISRLQSELRQLEAEYIADLSKLCPHEFDEHTWTYYSQTLDKNACKICGKKVVRDIFTGEIS